MINDRYSTYSDHQNFNKDAILNTIMLIKINVNVNSTDSIIISLRSGRLRCDIPKLKTLTELP